MIVSVRRTGGFAGLTEEVARVDVAALPSAARQRLEAAVAADGGFFALPSALPTTEVGADLWRWEVTVEDGGRAHTVACVGREAPADPRLRRLVETVLRL